MRTAVVLFTRDLRVHDHPALAEAVSQAESVVPLFVFDERIAAGPNRVRFLLDSLADLRRSLRGLGGTLVVRRGDVVAETMRVVEESGAEAVFLSEDVSRYAESRRRRLEAERVDLRAFPGVTVVPPGELRPTGGDHFRVFTPFWRRWVEADLRPVRRAPRRLSAPSTVVAAACRRPATSSAAAPRRSCRPEGRRRGGGGSTAGVAAGSRATPSCTTTSQPTEHRGSPRTFTSAAYPRGTSSSASPGSRAPSRSCASSPGATSSTSSWRRGPTPHRRTTGRGGDRWNDDAEGLAAWKEGRTGFPLVDAGMRQLAREGWMHNRARLVVGSFLTKDLYLDWRLGAAHFAELLVDGDVAQNTGNWQWVAGTGADTRPNRVLSPVLQARRFDPTGEYVRRYVEELADVKLPDVLEPWKNGDVKGYPAPLVDHAEAAARFRRRRAR